MQVPYNGSPRTRRIAFSFIEKKKKKEEDEAIYCQVVRVRLVFTRLEKAS
jgi:hypothetical protein